MNRLCGAENVHVTGLWVQYCLICAHMCVYTHKINSDSQAAVHALTLVTQTSKIEENCVIILNILGERNKVVLHWVPDISDNKINNAADEQAKVGDKETFIGPVPIIEIAYSLANFALLMFWTYRSPEMQNSNQGC